MIKPCRFSPPAFLVGIVMALLLAGCSVLPEREIQQIYTLPQTQRAAPVMPATSTQPWSLRIQTPYSNRMLNSNRIVVRPDNSEISVYKGVRWSDTAPVMLRNRLVDAFRTQSNIAAISNDSAHLASTLEFGGDLNRFQVEYQNGVPTVHIQLDAFLLDSSDGHIVASRRFSVEQPVNGTQVPEVVPAFGEAADRLAADVVAWVLKHSPNGSEGRTHE